LADVQALLAAVQVPAPAPQPEDYVPPSVAARSAGVPRWRVSYWAQTGKVASRPGPYGLVVRLGDVQALAQARAERQPDATSEGRE
jgi:hypothetical protein